MKNRCWIILSLFLLGEVTLAQNGLSIQVSASVGASVSHASKRNVPEKLHTGFNIDISKMTFGKKYWEADHGFPQMGVLVSFQSLGNREVYGSAISTIPYLEFNIWRFRAGILQVKHGTGVSWVSKRHHPDENPGNLLISTPLNATSFIDAGLRFALNGRNDLKIGGIVKHISNGGFLKPNFGSNTASLYLNYTYYFNEKPTERLKWTKPSFSERWRFRGMASMGLFKKDEIVRNVPQVSTLVFYQHNTRFRTGLGLEASFPHDFKSQLAIYAEEEVQFSRMVTRYGLGLYALNRRNDREVFYSKVGIAFYPQIEHHIPQGLFMGMMLKAHNFSAAHIELNTGYTF